MNIALMYHDVVSASPRESGFSVSGADSYKVKALDFENQVSAIAKLNTKNQVTFTFDDGGVGFYNCAAPILEKCGYRGIAFVSTSMIGKEGFMTAEQLRELDSRGHIIASHSHIHQPMHTLDHSVQCSEWKNSIEILSGILGHKVQTGSIPTGYSTKSVVEAARKSGITVLYTSKPDDNGGGYLSVKKTVTGAQNGLELRGRYVIHNSTSVEEITKIATSRMFRMWLHFKWAVLYAIKKLLGKSYSKVKDIILTVIYKESK